MPDIFQFYSNSADVAPGKGTGEQLESNSSLYSELRKIKNWRRILSEKSEGFQDVLKKTGSAQLWQGVPRKPSIRRDDLETLRTQLLESVESIEPKDTEQRIVQTASEMSEQVPASKKQSRSKKPTLTSAITEEAVTNIPEGAIATLLPTTTNAPTPLTQEEDKNVSTIKFCPVCKYYLYLKMVEDSEENYYHVRHCRNCGFNEKDEKGGLISEILVKETSAEGYKILLNEFTTRDYRLPHIRGSLKCPSAICESNTKGIESDIIYLKDDPINITYLYICNHCNTQWRSRR